MSARLASRISSRLTPRCRATSSSVGDVPEVLDQRGARLADLQQQFLHRPLDMDLPALVPEVALDLAGDARLGVGGQVPAECRVEVVDRLEQADVADLHQLFFRLRAVPVPAGARAHQRPVPQHQGLTRGGTPPGSGRQRVNDLEQFAVILRCRVDGRWRGREGGRSLHVYHLRILRAESVPPEDAPCTGDKHGRAVYSRRRPCGRRSPSRCAQPSR